MLRLVEARGAPPDIMRLIDQHLGEVLWIDGPAEAWFILGRPQWASPLQGNPLQSFLPRLPPNGVTGCKF